MRKIPYILIILFLSSCCRTNCNLKFNDIFNKAFLEYWQKSTQDYILKKGDKKLKLLLESENKLKMSMFSRESFMEISDTLLNRYDSQRFNSLIVIELNTTGKKTLLINI